MRRLPNERIKADVVGAEDVSAVPQNHGQERFMTLNTGKIVHAAFAMLAA